MTDEARERERLKYRRRAQDAEDALFNARKWWGVCIINAARGWDEVRHLREEREQANERIAELEARLAQREGGQSLR